MPVEPFKGEFSSLIIRRKMLIVMYWLGGEDIGWTLNYVNLDIFVSACEVVFVFCLCFCFLYLCYDLLFFSCYR